MYDRAQRVLTTVTGSTAEHVGPGTYENLLPNSKKIRSDGYAPFSSMTSRESFLNPNDTVIAAPGPGQYDPQLTDGVKGGHSLANKALRFKDQSEATPGPGAYSLSKKTDWIKEVGRPGATSTVSNVDSDRGTVMTSGKVKIFRKPVAPSIPTPGQAYGFEENDDGTLQRQDPPDRDISIGPAFYKVAEEPTKPTKAYNGVHFGKLTSKRMHFVGKDGPGPGDYDPFKPSSAVVTNLNLQEEDRSKFEARIPRYHEVVVKDEEKKNVPGPGKYQIGGQFDPVPVKVNTEGIEVEHPPFGSQAKRFAPGKLETPGPGAYDDPRTALEMTKRVTGLKRSPFSQTSVRFSPKHRVKNPGPASYTIAGMGAQAVRKACLESTRRGAFGSTAVRIKPMTKRNEVEIPGPAHYQIKERQPRYQQMSSNFASMSARLPAGPTDLPPPGSYNVARAFAKTQTKIEPKPPQTAAAKSKQGAFKSSSSRFAPPRDVIIAETDPSNPGPSTYRADRKQHIGNPIIGKDRRFKDHSTDVPGPGAYEFSPLIQDSVIVGTFNATLNNPIAPPIDDFHMGTASKQPFLLGV
ncbi:hypothetical protein CAPTEDRAFT_229364 [Capitella teleta]|uniref:Sperm-tail PG-rich repeat-containing protein 2 n=1 Tax=Capitella teleta TaxID=283909 RepID=R7V1Q8_CAPTE|nr:hypothetical protein CAPTEDRAFT_229364 [Capitella teleta]|eukprot:ELU09596.1 hypothetical protein CAPTEDRAFT_229364 [Capitella teleta]